MLRNDWLAASCFSTFNAAFSTSSSVRFSSCILSGIVIALLRSSNASRIVRLASGHIPRLKGILFFSLEREDSKSDEGCIGRQSKSPWDRAKIFRYYEESFGRGARWAFSCWFRTNQPQRGYAYALQVHVLAIDCPRRRRLSVRRPHCHRVHVTINSLRLHLENSMLFSCNFLVNK